jgi:hypothetical protein
MMMMMSTEMMMMMMSTEIEGVLLQMAVDTLS